METQSSTPTIKYLSDHFDNYTIEERKVAFPTKTKNGYGKKIKVPLGVRIDGWLYPVYATCFSNCASYWISIKGGNIYHLSEADRDNMQAM